MNFHCQIRCLFGFSSESVSNLEYVSSKGGMMGERWFANVLESNGCVLICNTMWAFVWRLREESWKATVKLLGVRSEIWVGNLNDKRLRLYRLRQRDQQHSW